MKIIGLEMSNGDPGYLAKGHLNKDEFVTEVNRQFDEEFEVADVSYIHATTHEKGSDECPDAYDVYFRWDKDAGDPHTLVTP